MDIRELRYFLQVVRSGSINRAAAQLNVTQPALSRQLKKLESELNVQLLIRNADGVRPTDAGSILVTQAEAQIFQLEEMGKLVRGYKDHFAGQIILGLPPTSGLLVAPKILETFRKLWPHTTLILREGISSLLEEWLLDRRLDIALLHSPLPMDGIHIETILHERMVLVLPPSASKELRLAKTIRIRDLGGIPLILPSLPHSNRRLIERAASQHGTSLNIINEIDSVALTKSLVKQNYGNTVMTSACVASDVKRGELDCRVIDRPPLMSTFCIGVPREAKSSGLVVETMRLLRDVITKLIENGEWAGARLHETEELPKLEVR